MRSPPRILIADDNEANLDILRTRLAGQGYEIVIAVDGDAALDGAREHHPDLILLDVMMPKRDGFEVCRLLKADPTLPFMPIILVTAKGDSRALMPRNFDVGRSSTSISSRSSSQSRAKRASPVHHAAAEPSRKL